MVEDLHRLAARSAARRGHAAVASAALAWGEPVLDSAISGVVDGKLFFRGHPIEALVARRASFEEVGDLLLGDAHGVWPSRVPVRARGARPLARLLSIAPALAARTGTPGELARFVVRALSCALGPARRTIAETAAYGLGARDTSAIELGLIVSADHELNPSTFAARIAAGAGASLGACVAAALFVVSGARHGSSHERIEELLASLPARRMGTVLRARVRAGERIPGFGHPLYPEGDPRARLVLDAIEADPRQRRRAAQALAFVHAGAAASGEPPAVDVALVALAQAVGARPGSAAGIFTLGRSVGWLAHALEQGPLAPLRPRARYVGVGVQQFENKD